MRNDNGAHFVGKADDYRGKILPLRQRAEEKRKLIQFGDLLNCDVDFYYLNLATDIQQNAYILKKDETDAPEGLKDALADGNMLQDILAEAMVTGRTGNEILKAALEKAEEEGINTSICPPNH